MSQLDADWLSVEFASAEAEVAGWSEGLKSSLVNREADQSAELTENTQASSGINSLSASSVAAQ